MTNNDNQYLAQELLEVHRTLGWMDLVIGSISDAVCVTDDAGHILYSNDCFSNLVDITRVFLLGRNFRDVFHIKETKSPLIEYRTTATPLSESNQGSKAIYQWEGPQGETKIFRIMSRTLPNINQTVYLIQDITKEYEFAKMKNKFVDLASHQLRTPMTAIMTYAHMLQDGFAGELQDDQAKIVDTIVTSSERMIKLVNGLLSITRAQNEVQVIKKRPVSVDSIFSQIHTEVSQRLAEKKLDFSLSVPEKLPPLHSDSAVLHEIFSNLIVNAIQYTPESGSIHVEVKSHENIFIFTVQDTGIGIPEEYHAELFNQFTRADNAYEAYPEGTGLGLYPIKILTGKIGAEITFTSKVNSGTTFTVSLPAR